MTKTWELTVRHQNWFFQHDLPLAGHITQTYGLGRYTARTWAIDLWDRPARALAIRHNEQTIFIAAVLRCGHNFVLRCAINFVVCDLRPGWLRLNMTKFMCDN